MNLNTLPTQDRFLDTASDEIQEADTAAGIAEFLLLEECVARCEALAEILGEDAATHPLMAELSECIAACDTYLAAKARESRHEARLGAYCADALASTAEACRALTDDTAVGCRKTCRACRKFLDRRTALPSPLYN